MAAASCDGKCDATCETSCEAKCEAFVLADGKECKVVELKGIDLKGLPEGKEGAMTFRIMLQKDGSGSPQVFTLGSDGKAQKCEVEIEGCEGKCQVIDLTKGTCCEAGDDDGEAECCGKCSADECCGKCSKAGDDDDDDDEAECHVFRIGGDNTATIRVEGLEGLKALHGLEGQKGMMIVKSVKAKPGCAGECEDCDGNCDDCDGNCDDCSDKGKSSACTGNCDDCTGSCDDCSEKAKSSACTGDCDDCDGNCDDCNGNCDDCSGKAAPKKSLVVTRPRVAQRALPLRTAQPTPGPRGPMVRARVAQPEKLDARGAELEALRQELAELRKELRELRNMLREANNRR